MKENIQEYLNLVFVTAKNRKIILEVSDSRSNFKKGIEDIVVRVPEEEYEEAKKIINEREQYMRRLIEPSTVTRSEKDLQKMIDDYNKIKDNTRQGINSAIDRQKNSKKRKISEKASKKKSKGVQYIGKKLVTLLVTAGFSIGALMATHAAKEKNVDLYEEYLTEATSDLGDEEAIEVINSKVEKQLALEFEAAFGKKVKNIDLGTTYTDTASYAGGPEITIELEDGTKKTFDQKQDLRTFGETSGTNQTDKISVGISKLQRSKGREEKKKAAAELFATLNKKDIVIEKDKRGNEIAKETRGNNSIPETRDDEER